MNKLTKGGKHLLFALFDIFAIGFSIIIAFWLRLGWPIGERYIVFLEAHFIAFVLIKFVIFYVFGMYRRLWRYAGIQELKTIIQAVVFSSLAILFLSYALGTLPIPRAVFAVDGLLTLFMVGGLRLFGRTMFELKLYGRAPAGARRVLIVGTGNAGVMLVKEMLKAPPPGYLPVGFIDDDPVKQGMRVHGVKVLGTRNDIDSILNRYPIQEVIIAMPSVSRKVKEEVVGVCNQVGIHCRTLPGIYEIIDGRVGIGQIRDVRIEDILGREPVKVNLDAIGEIITGSVIFVTGAGGSIGSELCRQISYLKPSVLVMVDIAENSLFEVEQDLLEKKTCQIMSVVADVKDESRMDELLQAYHPRIIFHAAAYKHVPMMELNPKAALENNFIGTMVLAEAAARHRVGKFVLISTDKAVNPVNVMGTSKALAERVVLSMEPKKTKFIVVRFGNVLASKGSVVPTFKKQIAKSGPITITHPDMKRYLMTITESVQLVLQAVVFGNSGDMFLLDMGDQVPIVELAEKLIELSGFRRDQISIEYIGIRPGEKLEEELVNESEVRTPSPHSKIFALQSREYDRVFDSQQLHEIESLIKQGQMRLAFAKISRIVTSKQIDPKTTVINA